MGKSPNTIDTYRILLSDFVRFANSIGATRPGEISEEHIVAYIIHKRKTCGGVAVATYYNHVRAWFNWMASPERRIIDRSPFATLKTPSIPKTIIKPLTAEQIQQMLECCPDYFLGVRDKTIVLLFYDSGLRRSEAVNIKLDDVDIKNGIIKVMGKGAKERRVAIGEETRRALTMYLLRRTDSQPWLFVTRDRAKDPEKMSPRAIYLVVKRLMQRAGITGVKLGPHTLRHSFATASIRNGANLFYVQSLLGHSTLNMTRRYAATVDSEEAIKNHKNFSPADRLRK